jgi:heme O synthase-like polyprenyltransferase
VERRTDALMRRTSGRPVPGGRLGVAEGTWFSIVLSAIGSLNWPRGERLPRPSPVPH